MFTEEIIASLKTLTSKHGLRLREIEETCKMSSNSLASILSGKRKFPIKHKEALQEYCKEKEIALLLGKPVTFKYQISEQEGQLILMKSLGISTENQTFEQAVNGVIILAGTYKGELEEMKMDLLLKLKSRSPENLAELKLMCPPDLTGFDRSEWISKERLKYGI